MTLLGNASGWGFVTEVQIDPSDTYTSGVSANVPLLITENWFNSDQLDADGAGVIVRDELRFSTKRFSTDAGYQEIPFEIETWSLNNDPSLSKVRIHARYPTIEAGVPRSIFMWRGNANAIAPSPSDANGYQTAYNNYDHYWPLNESPLDASPQFKDRTSNAAGMTQSGLGASDYISEGSISGGNVSYFKANDSASVSGLSIPLNFDASLSKTVTVWVRHETLVASTYFLSLRAAGADQFWMQSTGGADQIRGNNNFTFSIDVPMDTIQTWHRVDYVFRSGQGIALRNGIVEESRATFAGSSTIDEIRLGVGGVSNMDSRVGFISIRNADLSTDQILTEYRYWVNAASIPVVGTEQATAVPRSLTLTEVRVGSVARLYALDTIGGAIQSTFDSINSSTANDTLDFSVTTTVAARLVLAHPDANFVYTDLTLNTDEGQQVPAGALQSRDKFYDASDATLARTTNVAYDFSVETARTIELLGSTRHSASTVYSSIKSHWLDTADPNIEDLLQRPFPFDLFFLEKQQLVNYWNWANNATRNLLAGVGYAFLDGADNSSAIARYVGINIIGGASIAQEAPYYQFDSQAPVNLTYLSEVAQYFEDGSFSYSSLKIFSRPQGRSFSESDLSSVGESALDFKKISFPFPASVVDSKIQDNDGAIAANSPYTGMSISEITASGFTAWADATVYAADAVVSDGGRWYQTTLGGTSSGTGVGDDTGVTDWSDYSGERQINGTWYPFTRFLDRGSGSLSQAYTYGQYRLRQSAALGNAPRGDTARLLMEYLGDRLDLFEGLFIEDFAGAFGLDSTSSITFLPSGGGTVTFTPNLTIILRNAPAGAALNVWDDEDETTSADHGTLLFTATPDGTDKTWNSGVTAGNRVIMQWVPASPYAFKEINFPYVVPSDSAVFDFAPLLETEDGI